MTCGFFSLGYNGIGTTGAGYLAEQLESNTTIKDLELVDLLFNSKLAEIARAVA